MSDRHRRGRFGLLVRRMIKDRHVYEGKVYVCVCVVMEDILFFCSSWKKNFSTAAVVLLYLTIHYKYTHFKNSSWKKKKKTPAKQLPVNLFSGRDTSSWGMLFQRISTTFYIHPNNDMGKANCKCRWSEDVFVCTYVFCNRLSVCVCGFWD